MKNIVKKVLEHAGSKFILDPNTIFYNIELLKRYGIKIDDSDDRGFSVLGMDNLEEKLLYLFDRSNSKENINLDQLRKLIINDGYKSCKNNNSYDNIYTPQKTI